jgi:hypothetical protein
MGGNGVGPGTNPSDMSAFGPGMYLTPAVMRDGDTDNSGSLSADEFHTLAEQWFAAWDRDSDTLLDSNQIRDGLKDMLRPPP